MSMNEATSRGGIEPRRLFKYCKGDARPLWKHHNNVPASRGGVKIENKIRLGKIVENQNLSATSIEEELKWNGRNKDCLEMQA